MIWPWVAGAATVGALGLGAATAREFRRRALHRWLLPNLFATPRPRPKPGEPIDVLIAVCDHYEPMQGKTASDRAKAQRPAMGG